MYVLCSKHISSTQKGAVPMGYNRLISGGGSTVALLLTRYQTCTHMCGTHRVHQFAVEIPEPDFKNRSVYMEGSLKYLRTPTLGFIRVLESRAPTADQNPSSVFGPCVLHSVPRGTSSVECLYSDSTYLLPYGILTMVSVSREGALLRFACLSDRFGFAAVQLALGSSRTL